MKPTDSVILLCCAIATQEGYFNPDPSVPPRRLNNPGDINYAGQQNASRAEGTSLAHFCSPGAGIAALFRQVWLYVAMGKTVREIIEIWAPPNENNTEAYITNVLAWTKLQPDVPMLQQIAPLVNLAGA
jgi:hypothetical protein